MPPTWNAFEPAAVFPEPLQRAAETVNASLEAVGKATKVVETALRVAQRLARSAQQNPAEIALRKAIEEIDEFIRGITGNTQCHAIIIPIRKQVARGTDSNLNYFQDFVRGFDDPAFQFIERAKAETGGNAVFWRTLAESVRDAGDPARPDFPSNYATVGACVIAGGESLSDLAVPMQFFTNVFRGNLRIGPDAGVIPVVQNLRVTTLAARQGVGTVISWDPLAVTRNLPLFTGDIIRAKEIFLIRSERPFGAGMGSWLSLFEEEPSSNIRDLPQVDGAQVIARIRNHGLVRSYTDKTNLLDPDKTYYFTAAVRYQVDEEWQPMGPFSNVVRTSRTGPAPATARGTPPDWIATPSLAAAIPPLEQVINTVRLALSRVGSRTTLGTGTQQMLEQTLRQLSRLVAEWEMRRAEVEEVTARLQRMTSTFAPGGVYSTVIASNNGGTDAWMAELARRLNMPDEPSAPNFSPTSVVIGFVIIAGAPRPPELLALRALLELLFGDRSAPPARTAVADFSGTGGASGGSTDAPAPILGYDPQLNPSTTPQC